MTHRLHQSPPIIAQLQLPMMLTSQPLIHANAQLDLSLPQHLLRLAPSCSMQHQDMDIQHHIPIQMHEENSHDIYVKR